MKSKKGKVFCVFSAKGGVGKTTTVLNLAGTYEKMDKKVLIIDMDLSAGGIAIALNKVPEKSIYNMIDDMDNTRYNSLSEYTTKYDDYIDFLASPKDPRQAGKINSKYLSIILDKAIYSYDVVIIDTNHIINEINLTVLERVDNILFMVTNDPYDLKNMKSLISIFKDLGMTNYKVLLNNSRDPFKNYFSLYDLKNILKSNIDYTLSNHFFVKDIDEYVVDGQIITLNKKNERAYAKDFTSLITIATDMLDLKEEVQDEK